MDILHRFLVFSTSPKFLSSKTEKKVGGRKNLRNRLENSVKDFLTGNMPEMTPGEFRKNYELINIFEDDSLTLEGDAETPFFVYQPFGTQKPPDFIIVLPIEKKLYYVVIECKSSKTSRAMWNDSLPVPKPNFWYCHLNTTTNQFSIVPGNKLIEKTQRKAFKKMVEEIRETPRTLGSWKLYFRPQFQTNEYFEGVKYVSEIQAWLSGLSGMSGEYSSWTEKCLETFDRDSRANLGQFFTPHSLALELIEKVKEHMDLEDIKILEPAAGTGQFLDVLTNFVPPEKLGFCEIDKTLRKHLRGKYLFVDKDFLDLPDKPAYDLIIGNPPYFELGSERNAGSVSKLFETTLKKGRYNMFACFIEKAIRLLHDKGIVAFIIPPALNSSPTFSKLREYIHETCKILWISEIPKFSEDTSQTTEYIILRKRKIVGGKKDPHYDESSGYLIVSGEVSEREGLEEEGSVPLLKDIAQVSGGTVVWNSSKKDLTGEYQPGAKRLIYSTDIPDFSDTKHSDYHYYTGSKAEIKLPAIICSRSKNPKFMLLSEGPEGIPVIGENHVNIITAEDKKILKKLYKYLISDEFGEYIKKNSKTLNFSKSQLEKVPLRGWESSKK